jgi:hypothetical protein
MKRLVGAVVLMLAVTMTARAHFLFLVPPSEGRTVQVVFSDSTNPDNPKLLAKIAHTTFQVVDESGKLTPVKAKNAGKTLDIILPGTGQAEVIGRCVYGVVDKGKEPFLLNYYGRAYTGKRGLLGRKLPDEAKHPLQIVLVDSRPERRARVLWQGKPLAGAEVVSISEKDVTTKTDDKGEVNVGKGLSVVLRARHIEDKKGTHDGKKYSSVRHYATLVWRFPRVIGGPVTEEMYSGEDPAATKLLADARAARANWEQFPGFTADVEVNVEGKRTAGKLEVSSKGTVSLQMKGDAKEWTRRMIASIVSHRLDDSSTLTTPCAFADDVTDHPMGRAIRVLNDEHHSSYRIRDRQVIEVNRSMGEARFTITVLENRKNEEKKYLPASYVVNTWATKSGALQSSVTHHNTWQRVGKFDLPKGCTVVTATQGKLLNRTIRFSNVKLAEKKE